MGEQDIKSIALFFFLALLDDKTGVELSKRLVKRLKRLWLADVSVDQEISLLTECYKDWDSYLKTREPVIGSVVSGEETWMLPKNVGLEAWKKFLQSEQTENIFPLIWSEVLGRSEDKIGKALNISVGTVRTRIARALVHLGSHCTAESANA